MNNPRRRTTVELPAENTSIRDVHIRTNPKQANANPLRPYKRPTEAKSRQASPPILTPLSRKPGNRSVGLKLLCYFLQDDVAPPDGIDLAKGLMLCRPVGCGKTCLLNIMRLLCTDEYWPVMVAARDVAMELIVWSMMMC